MLRRLRIAASVFFAVVAVALCLLWVRSYWWLDITQWQISKGAAYQADSISGKLLVYRMTLPAGFDWTSFKVTSLSVSKHVEAGRKWFDCQFAGDDFSFQFPHIVPVAVFTLSALAVGWPKSGQFSLRTLLIAMTLAAVVLGLGVWLAS